MGETVINAYSKLPRQRALTMAGSRVQWRRRRRGAKEGGRSGRHFAGGGIL